MTSTSANTKKFGSFGNFQPTPNLVRWVVDFAGKWAAPIMILMVMAVAAIFAPAFFRPSNLKTILLQIAVLGVVTIGQTLVLLNRSIDMSVSAVLALGAVIVVQTEAGNSIIVTLIQAIVIAAIIGLANGYLVAKRHVPPFVATFWHACFVGGARLAYTKGQASGTVPDFLRAISIESIGPVPAALIVWLLINAIVIFVLCFTRFGRWVYAVGGNPGAAKYAGIKVDRVIIISHMFCSIFAIISGLLLSGYIGYVDLRMGSDYNMNSIAAAIVGGTTFTGWAWKHVWHCSRCCFAGYVIKSGRCTRLIHSLAVCNARFNFW